MAVSRRTRGRSSSSRNVMPKTTVDPEEKNKSFVKMRREMFTRRAHTAGEDSLEFTIAQKNYIRPTESSRSRANRFKASRTRASTTGSDNRRCKEPAGRKNSSSRSPHPALPPKLENTYLKEKYSFKLARARRATHHSPVRVSPRRSEERGDSMRRVRSTPLLANRIRVADLQKYFEEKANEKSKERASSRVKISSTLNQITPKEGFVRSMAKSLHLPNLTGYMPKVVESSYKTRQVLEEQSKTHEKLQPNSNASSEEIRIGNPRISQINPKNGNLVTSLSDIPADFVPPTPPPVPIRFKRGSNDSIPVPPTPPPKPPPRIIRETSISNQVPPPLPPRSLRKMLDIIIPSAPPASRANTEVDRNESRFAHISPIPEGWVGTDELQIPIVSPAKGKGDFLLSPDSVQGRQGSVKSRISNTFGNGGGVSAVDTGGNSRGGGPEGDTESISAWGLTYQRGSLLVDDLPTEVERKRSNSTGTKNTDGSENAFLQWGLEVVDGKLSTKPNNRESDLSARLSPRPSLRHIIFNNERPEVNSGDDPNQGKHLIGDRASHVTQDDFTIKSGGTISDWGLRHNRSDTKTSESLESEYIQAAKEAWEKKKYDKQAANMMNRESSILDDDEDKISISQISIKMRNVVNMTSQVINDYHRRRESRLSQSVMGGLDVAPRKRKIKYTRIKLLGRGAFGCVFLAKETETKRLIAVKRVELKRGVTSDVEREIRTEVNAMKRLRNPHIVEMLDCSFTGKRMEIYMEYVDGNSLDYQLKIYGPFPEMVIKYYTVQILQALAYCHGLGVIHRDIKGKNILVTAKGFIKLADFGSAKIASEGLDGRPNNISKKFSSNKTFKYTPQWVAPEVVADNSVWDEKVDIWSLGCVVQEMASAKPPWYELGYENEFQIIHHINEHGSVPEISNDLSPLGRKFALSCLGRDPKKRPNAPTLLCDEWVLDIWTSLKKKEAEKLAQEINFMAKALSRKRNQENESDDEDAVSTTRVATERESNAIRESEFKRQGNKRDLFRGVGESLEDPTIGRKSEFQYDEQRDSGRASNGSIAYETRQEQAISMASVSITQGESVLGPSSFSFTQAESILAGDSPSLFTSSARNPQRSTSNSLTKPTRKWSSNK